MNQPNKLQYSKEQIEEMEEIKQERAGSLQKYDLSSDDLENLAALGNFYKQKATEAVITLLGFRDLGLNTWNDCNWDQRAQIIRYLKDKGVLSLAETEDKAPWQHHELELEV